MAGPTPKVSGTLDGDTPEQVAWGLLQWISLVENVRDRASILGIFHEGLSTARGGVASEPDQAATGVHRLLAYKLLHLVAEAEGRDPGQRNQGDRAWVMDTYTECLQTVLGRRQPAAVSPAADSDPSSQGPDDAAS